MCRFVAYLGEPLVMDAVLIQPDNSIIEQSRAAREMVQPVNGDGFGLGWYNHVLSTEPAVFRSIRPAWNDQNLLSISLHVKSPCFVGHVRAASVGGVTRSNCHPFCYQKYLFMHNGKVDNFIDFKRALCMELTDQSYQWIRGETDSEHLCALFIDNLQQQPNESVGSMAVALKQAVQVLVRIQRAHAPGSHSIINAVVTDGQRMVALRYVCHQEHKTQSLYYSIGSEYQVINGQGHLRTNVADAAIDSVLIASERLSDNSEEWLPVPLNHFVLIDEELSVQVKDFVEV